MSDADLLTQPLPPGVTLDSEFAPGITVREFLGYIHRPPTPPGWERREGVAYGSATAGGRQLTLDLYLPTDALEPLPGVVFVHAGGWSSGGPEGHVRNAVALAERGYISALIRYRLASEAPWPAALEDTKCAIRWMRANAEALNLDAERLAVAGDSAGGHLALLAAFTPGLFERAGGHADVPSTVAAVAAWCPLVDLSLRGVTAPALHRLVDSFLRGANPRVASPVSYVSTTCPPVLTMTGSDDPGARLESIEEFHARLDALDVPNELAIWPGRGHGFHILAHDWPSSFERLVRFLDMRLRD